MQLFVRNKIISLGGSSTVKDAQGNDVFKVKGNIMTVTKKKRVCDMNDNVLYTVRCRWLNPLAHKAYIYDADGNKIATIKRPFMSIKQKFFVTTDQGEIMVEGGFFSMHCLIKRGRLLPRRELLHARSGRRRQRRLFGRARHRDRQRRRRRGGQMR